MGLWEYGAPIFWVNGMRGNGHLENGHMKQWTCGSINIGVYKHMEKRGNRHMGKWQMGQRDYSNRHGYIVSIQFEFCFVFGVAMWCRPTQR